MQAHVARLRGSQIFRYIFIGGISYVIELTVLLFFADMLSFSPEIAVACSFWVGLAVSFLLQKYIAFGNRVHDKKALGKQAFMYGALILFNYIFTITFVSLFNPLLGLPIARTAALLLTVSWNFFVYKKMFR